MDDETYDGYSNRETATLAFYLHNNRELYELTRKRLRAVSGGRQTQVNGAVRSVAEDMLRVDHYVERHGGDHLPAELSRVAEDIGSLWRVDWDEVGASFLEDLAEEDGDDDE